MASYPQPSVEDVQAAFARYRAETELVINGLIGAMPPALQRRWPNIISRARRLTSIPADRLSSPRRSNLDDTAAAEHRR